MNDHEEAPLAGAENILLSAEEIEEIRQHAREIAKRERKARRRKVPQWNPDTDSPWRSLDHCFVDALKGSEIRAADLETILARGQVPLTGARDDLIGDLPDRIEKLVAAAERRSFFFEDNSILAFFGFAERPVRNATSTAPPDRVALFGQKSALLHGRWPRITFSNVGVHWPKFIEALQGAGFKISATPKPGKPTRASPPQTLQNGAAAGDHMAKKKQQFWEWAEDEKKTRGSLPRLQSSKYGGQTVREWGVHNRVPRAIVESWGRDLGCSGPGRPRN
jgi:hypothetical protein